MSGADQMVLIVGAGQAGYQTAESLRQEGFEGAIVMVGAEPVVPYQRPPLSKTFFSGDVSEEQILFRMPEWYRDHRIDLRTGLSVTAIDRAEKTATLSDGTALSWDRLVLTTGGRVRKLDLPGADLQNLFYLKTLADVHGIREAFDKAQRIVIVGAGFIGLEFASVARKSGKEVTVLEAAPRVMGRAVSPELSGWFADLHRENGVRLLTSTGVQGFQGDNGAVASVDCADGTTLPADLVLAGIGMTPETGLAEACGLHCDNGILVNAYGETSDPAILAAGDCCSFQHPFVGRRVRLESVQNAADQGRAVAARIAGHDKPYHAVPWFWSDQFGRKLQITGLYEEGLTTVLRGDRDAGKFSLFHFRDGALRCVESVAAPADHIQGRKLLAASVYPTREQAADPAFKLKTLLS